MPELPEVETVCRGIRPHLQGRVFTQATVRQPQLRWPVPDNLNELLRNQTVHSVNRRAKYVLVELDQGSLMVHLGMSGRLYFVPAGTPAAKHDHVDFALDSGQLLRYTDPRRFGAVLWLGGEASEHHLLSHLGPEPLSEDFNAGYLFSRAKGRKVPVKTLLMDGRVVVGVGNIYANEALFMAGIRPDREAGSISKVRYQRLVMCVKQASLGLPEPLALFVPSVNFNHAFRLQLLQGRRYELGGVARKVLLDRNDVSAGEDPIFDLAANLPGDGSDLVVGVALGSALGHQAWLESWSTSRFRYQSGTSNLSPATDFSRSSTRRRMSSLDLAMNSATLGSMLGIAVKHSPDKPTK